ncbi:sulfatase-like hydrolase/transferase [Sporosarcina sp. FSL W7-1349]|uniref:sulfatase-like hydrolase/transferase n=1 Tax=Sporosarcina sp. FSL W7-1349 TaxID=2921561 RepID=UPI0030FAC4A9
MSTTPKNLLFIMSDEHNKEMTGCYGHPVVKTPNIDKLASNGVRFESAYCNSPICVPSRASMATGRYPHQIESWDNAHPYDGTIPSWGHRLTEQGYKVTTIGKLHFRNDEDDTGFPDQRYPMHVHGKGDLYSLIREDMEDRPKERQKILDAGPGESSYTRYDENTAQEARNFILNEGRDSDKPWVLFVSFGTPHFPLIAPEEYYSMYPLEDVVFPKYYSLEERHNHPILQEIRRITVLDDELDEMAVRKAVAAYYGLCSFMDAQIGKVLGALEEAGLAEDTRIIYTSDHGDTIGEHGHWFKSTMYEGSVSVPFILSGPDLPKGKVVKNHVSLIDCFPTIVNAVGANLNEEDQDLPGQSLFQIATGERDPERTVFSEYHAANSSTAYFMLRYKQYKYIYYVGYEPQLFDLEQDPGEKEDLASLEAYQSVLEECEKELRKIADPELLDKRARRSQANKIEENGGKEKILQTGFAIPYSPTPKQFQ